MTTAEELIAIGRQYYREGRFAEAERAFDRPCHSVVDLVLAASDSAIAERFPRSGLSDFDGYTRALGSTFERALELWSLPAS